MAITANRSQVALPRSPRDVEEDGVSPQTHPRVSVLMGMYNCAGTLAEAIESILGQTLVDWELVACDDGSTDGTWAVAKAFSSRAPGRIVLLRNQENVGLAATLNRCLAMSRGAFLARQDGDDLSEPVRFERQLSFLQANPKYAWVSSGMTVFRDGKDVGVRVGKPAPDARDLIRTSPYAHAPTMFRREALEAVGGYRALPYTRRTEDYDLWMRLHGLGFKGFNLQEPLYRVREDREAYSRKAFRFRLDEARTRIDGYRAMRTPLWAYGYVLRPILIGLLPLGVLRSYHEWRAGRARE